jgi:methionyl-tRNA formyltransferase
MLKNGNNVKVYNTVLVTNGNLLSLISLRHWLDCYGHVLKAVVITTKLPSAKNNIRGVLDILVNSGFRYCFFKLFFNVFYPIILRLSGKPYDLKSYLRGSGLEFIYTDNANADWVVNKLKTIGPDILLSFSATTRFDAELLSVAKRASVNLHYALLPEYAGLSPYFWYLFNDEEKSGCTLHVISDRLDAGNIIEQRSFPMEGITSVARVLLEQAKLASPMLNRYYGGEISEDVVSKQDMARRSYYRHPTRAQATTFHKQGKQYVKREDLHEIYKLVS